MAGLPRGTLWTCRQRPDRGLEGLLYRGRQVREQVEAGMGFDLIDRDGEVANGFRGVGLVGKDGCKERESGTLLREYRLEQGPGHSDLTSADPFGGFGEQRPGDNDD